MPAEYFLLTFTLPADVRALAWAQRTVDYDSLMRCSWETVRTFSLNDRQLQGHARRHRGAAYQHAPAGLSPPCASGHAGGGA